MSRRQLRGLGVSEAKIARWIRHGYLRKVLPHVYAVGHVADSVEADLVAAILYAGPGAMLSHTTALWWHGLLAQRPSTIQISTPRNCRSLPEIRVYARRKLELEHRRRVPTTTVSQALLDFAATAPVDRVVRALAQAEFQRVLDVARLRAFCGPGRPGSRTLKQAIRRHTPALAATKSELENAFHALCRRGGIPPYEVNRRVCGIEVDALWPELRVVVELDGVQGHATEAQMRRDRRRELELRLGGYVVLRYSYDQIMYEPEAVLADLRAALKDAAKRGAWA